MQVLKKRIKFFVFLSFFTSVAMLLLVSVRVAANHFSHLAKHTPQWHRVKNGFWQYRVFFIQGERRLKDENIRSVLNSTSKVLYKKYGEHVKFELVKIENGTQFFKHKPSQEENNLLLEYTLTPQTANEDYIISHYRSFLDREIAKVHSKLSLSLRYVGATETTMLHYLITQALNSLEQPDAISLSKFLERMDRKEADIYITTLPIASDVVLNWGIETLLHGFTQYADIGALVASLYVENGKKIQNIPFDAWLVARAVAATDFWANMKTIKDSETEGCINVVGEDWGKAFAIAMANGQCSSDLESYRKALLEYHYDYYLETEQWDLASKYAGMMSEKSPVFGVIAKTEVYIAKKEYAQARALLERYKKKLDRRKKAMSKNDYTSEKELLDLQHKRLDSLVEE